MNAASPDLPDSHADKPRPRKQPMTWRKFLKPIASLQLTVVLFALSVLLVFFGTLAQKTQGIWNVVDQYFWSWFVMVDAQPTLEFGKIFFGLPPTWNAPSWFALPLPAGKLLGGLMFANLLAAHAVRFKLTWKRSGIFILHAGLMLLFIGEYITREFQVEQQMIIDQGGSADFSVNTKDFELAFEEDLHNGDEHVTVLPIHLLKTAAKRNTANPDRGTYDKVKTILHKTFLNDGDRIGDPELPCDVRVERFYVNSRLAELAKLPYNPATAGTGLRGGVLPASEVPGVDPTKESDVPSCYVTLYDKGSVEPLGTYLMSLFIEPQTIALGGKTYSVSLRRTHYYKPFALHLIDFKFDRYRGTQTAKNYSSKLRLVDPEKGQDREVIVSMNEPLRHRGETFYQADFDKKTEKTTYLQVVRNPGWLIPYISCAMVSLGMLIHFGIALNSFVRKASGRKQGVGDALLSIASPMTSIQASVKDLLVNPAVKGPAHSKWEWIVPLAAVTFAALYLAGQMMPRSPSKGLDLREAARIPVIEGGRVKPLDTIARVDLRQISTREEFTNAEGTQPAIRWYFDTASAPGYTSEPAASNKVFRVEHDQVLTLLGLTKQDGQNWCFSHAQIWKKRQELAMAAGKAAARPEKERDLYEVKLLELWRKLGQYEEVGTGDKLLMFPPFGDSDKWTNPRIVSTLAETEVLRRSGLLGMQISPDVKVTSIGDLRRQARDVKDEQKREQLNREFDKLDDEKEELASQVPVYAAWENVLAAYRAGKQDKFDDAVREYRAAANPGFKPGEIAKSNFEAWHNEAALYYHCTGLYVMAALLAVGGFFSLLFGNPTYTVTFRRSAMGVLLLTFLVHGFTLFSRMYLMERPLVFVTNLYSSAVFIGWAGVGLCLIIERILPVGLANILGAVLGFSTGIIAHNLAASGDTLEMMQAVLDTNFWLATHVTTVTFGYAATYIAGLAGLVYIAFGVFTPWLKTDIAMRSGDTTRTTDVGKIFGQIIYAIVCIAAMLSFIGTVLGGIWADQSWGRFWGWDPKENGAVLIVLWNALILHARWCGLVKDRGTAVLALVGNMITTWSWFGTNQLGVGLHAYGFSNTLATGCMVTWVAHLGFIGVGLIPQRFWMSNQPKATRVS